MDYVYFDVTWDIDEYDGKDLENYELKIVPVINGVPFSITVEKLLGWDKDPDTMFDGMYSGQQGDWESNLGVTDLDSESIRCRRERLLLSHCGGCCPYDVKFSLVVDAETVRYEKFYNVSYDDLTKANFVFTFEKTAYLRELENLKVRIDRLVKTLLIVDKGFNYAKYSC